MLILAGLGPRIISVPIMLAERALHEFVDKNVNVFVPQPLFYRSVRSKGEGSHSNAWDLSEEYFQIKRLTGKRLG
jgi:hypothetical protein